MYNTNMKRLNPNTNQPFKRGDIRKDGYLFDKYNLSAKVKKDGFYQENWLSPKVFNKESKNALIRTAQWYEKNKEQSNKTSAKWRLKNKEKNKKLVSTWFANNKDKRASYEGKRRAAQLQRTPNWLTESELRMIEAKYSLAAMLTRETGILYHVDHIIPLQGKKVSGLHVFSNLRVIPATDNVKKSNSYQI
jgi:hypothetical protein